MYTHAAGGEWRTVTEGGVTTTYDYDAVGNLRTVTLPSGTTLEYVIDGRNRRVGRKVNGTLTQGYLYDGQLRIVAELDGANNVTARYVYGTRPNVPEWLEKGGQTYRIITDHLGSPRLVVNATSGAIVQRMDYDSWGNITNDTSPGFQIFGYAGGLYDQDTKLTRYGARDYDAHTGRWTAKDPIGFNGGDTNIYGYCTNDPLNKVDIDGRIVAAVDAALLTLMAALLFAVATNPSFRDSIGQVIAGLSGMLNGISLGSDNNGGDEKSTEPKVCPLNGRRNLPKKGIPNSTDVNDKGDGKGQIRDYDNLGNARKDIDFGHDHGAGDPHAHDWDWNDLENPMRGPGRPIGPGD
ncbi:MAG: hypothetical protein IPO76_03890 [Elusimicrobia bacterium]|nr:hypothetical protein [Elusimicrobiota bacterium]